MRGLANVECLQGVLAPVHLKRAVHSVAQTAQQLKLLTEAKMLCPAERRPAAQQASTLPSMQEEIAEAAEGASTACRSAEQQNRARLQEVKAEV